MVRSLSLLACATLLVGCASDEFQSNRNTQMTPVGLAGMCAGTYSLLVSGADGETSDGLRGEFMESRDYWNGVGARLDPDGDEFRMAAIMPAFLETVSGSDESLRAKQTRYAAQLSMCEEARSKGDYDAPVSSEAD
jgi:hypothetical protein